MDRATTKKHCPMALRGAIVGQYLAGIKYAKISESLNVSIKTVKRWVNRYRNENNLNRRPQPGQVRKINPEQRKIVVNRIEENPFTNAAVVGREFGVHKNTVRKVWKEEGIFHGVAERKPKLTEAQKEARMGYDEKTFVTDRHQRLHVYRPKNSRFDEKYIQERQRSGRISAGYWGWISKDGPGELVPIGGRLNSAGYVEILEDVLKPTMTYSFGGLKDMVFMQDNCSIHTAKICQKWFENHQDLVRLVAPVNSPDLNPIENVWGETTREWKDVFPRNRENLDASVMQNWEKLRGDSEYFQALYDSMPARLNAVIDANGGHTKY